MLIGAVLLTLVTDAIGQETATTPLAATEDAEQAPPVTQVFDLREEVRDFGRDIEDIDPGAFLAERSERIVKLKADLGELSALEDAQNMAALSFEALLDAQTELRAELEGLEELFAELDARATRRDAQLDELAELRSRWEEAAKVARQRSAPPAVLQIIAATEPQLDGMARTLRQDRDAALSGLAEIESLKLQAARFQSEVQTRRQALEVASQTAAGAPLWDTRVWSDPLGGAEGKRELRRQGQTLVAYLDEHGAALAALLFALVALVYWVLRRTGARVAGYLEKDALSLRAAAVFERPFSASLLVSLLGVYWLAPPAPAVFLHLIGALLPIPAAALAVTLFARPVWLSVCTLAFLLVLLQAQLLLDTMPAVSRAIAALQPPMLIFAFLADLRRGNWMAAFPRAPQARIRLLVRSTCGLFAVILLTEAVGYVGLAGTLRSLVFGGLGLGLIFVSAYYVLTGVVLALLWMRPFSRLSIVQRERWTMTHMLRRLILAVAVVSWLLATLSISGFTGVVGEAVGNVLGTDLQIGAVSLSVAALIYGVLILAATYVVSRLVRFFFESGARDGRTMAVGAAFAISKLMRYVIAVVGFLFAIVVMGFDLTSVTVLAGAVGVGLGFGLQAIFNNFFSGLILLVEQPIKVNDIAKVGELMGTVKEVGIRATVIETFDGAEVIVPNADFISKTVLNWTKSNRRRRAEIDVGVAYGTDPDEVIAILESAAAECEDVSDEPAALAIFTGFGDSSLNFRLYVWLTDLSNILRVPSRIRGSILEKLAGAGIEVPFPQRDVRVVMSGEAGRQLPHAPESPQP